MHRLRVASLALLGACLLPAMALAAVPSAAAAGRNLLANPGFEEGLESHPWMPAAWDTFASSLTTVFFGRDTAVARTGRHSVSVASISGRLPMWHNWSQSLVVGPETWNQDVVFTVWTRSMSLQGRGYLLVQAFNDTIGKTAILADVPRDTAMIRMNYVVTGQPIVLTGWKRLYFSEEETDWVRREARIFVPAGTNLISVRAGILGTGQLSLDDASLTLAPATPPAPVATGRNLMRDPGFEGDGNEWELSMAPFEDLRMERDTSVARSGRASMHVVASPRGAIQVRTGIGQTLDGRGLGGKRIRLNAWVKTDSLTGLAYPGLYCSTIDGDVLGTPPEQHGGTFDWKRFTLERDVPPGCLIVGAYIQFNSPATGHLWIDDVSLEVVGPAEYVTKKLPAPKAAPLPVPLR